MLIKKTVLIYDDDKEILFLCKAILGDKLYHVETLSHCENVLTDVALIKPDLILMDLWIPSIGGEKAITLLKENLLTRNIPVLLFSANPEIETISKKIHADGYIQKPFDIALLKETIEKKLPATVSAI
jgi:DNA-binding NtrC family response regulator